MKKIKSKFVRNKIKGLKWNEKNADYIRDLMDIELFVFGKYMGIHAGYMQNDLERKYPKEWEAIFNELNPGSIEFSKKLKEKEREEEREHRKILNEELKKEKIEFKRLWLKCGGKT
ncbi:MAG: hypothetical protein ABIH25_00380 [Candidatus Woesearchaeota archaeon]